MQYSRFKSDLYCFPDLVIFLFNSNFDHVKIQDSIILSLIFAFRSLKFLLRVLPYLCVCVFNSVCICLNLILCQSVRVCLPITRAHAPTRPRTLMHLKETSF